MTIAAWRTVTESLPDERLDCDSYTPVRASTRQQFAPQKKRLFFIAMPSSIQVRFGRRLTFRLVQKCRGRSTAYFLDISALQDDMHEHRVLKILVRASL